MNELEVLRLDKLFTEQELQEINDLFESNIPKNSEKFRELGRLNVLLYGFPAHLTQKLTDLANSLRDPSEPLLDLVLAPSAVEYNAKYGVPNLLPHYDGDWTDLIFDFQLSSNTDWPLGVELGIYPLEDNSAIVFNPNKALHWRPAKTFQGDEYIRLVFFRFLNQDNPTDNDGLQIAKPEEAHYKEVGQYRESL